MTYWKLPRPSWLTILIILGLIAGMSSCAPADNGSTLALIPLPVSMAPAPGNFNTIKKDIVILTDINLLDEARFLQEKLKIIPGLDIGIQTPGLADSIGPGSTLIRLANGFDSNITPTDLPVARAREAYHLRTWNLMGDSSNPAILIQANDNAGIFYGVQTLLQILANSSTRTKQGELQLPALDIKDWPRFSWRGSMLDSSRHYISVDYIKRHLELMASLKLNVFHWHLTDDQGWRFPVDGLDRLTSIGAWRAHAEPNGQDANYGGFYSKAEIRDIVSFATARHIMIVPEVDMPGHASAAIASYSTIACSGPHAPHLSKPLSEWGIFGNNLCPGKEATFDFVTKVVEQLTKLFPGPYIHFGGDEVHDISSWESCPDCQDRLRKIGGHDTRQLERYFISRVEQIIRDHDRIPMAWDDVVHSVSQTSTLLQFWSNQTHLQEGKDIGFEFVLSPGAYSYLDMNYAEGEVQRWAGHISIEKAYSLDPAVWNLEDAQVRGLEAPLWTEYTPDENSMDRQIWPRLSAIAEAAWTPAARRNWTDYAKRLVALAPLLEARGVKFYRSPELDWDRQ